MQEVNNLASGHISYCTKEDLYKYISELKMYMQLSLGDVGLDFFSICKQIKNLDIRIVGFKDKSLRGLSHPKDRIILLNSSRSEIERNFDCAHELIHVIKHKNENCQSFNCFDRLQPMQNSYLEWQANEGAAEMLVPYKVFIPLFCTNVTKCKGSLDYQNLKEELAEHFQVPVMVIELRIDNLKYEIQQFEQGCDVNHLCILSNNEQLRRGINVPSYNMKFEFYDLIV